MAGLGREGGGGLFLLLVPGVALQVILVVPNATVPEKAAFQLDCSITSRSSQDSRFAVAWFSLRTKVSGEKGSPGLAGQEEQEEEQEEEQGEDPTERTALLRVGPDGVFGPEGGPWEGRLRFQRPSLLLFRLTVLQASPQDTGNYSCRVEEWLPGPQGDWYLLAEEESAPISIRVLDTGSTLQSSIGSKDALFYFVLFYPFPIFGILIITILLLRFKSQNSKAYRCGRVEHSAMELSADSAARFRFPASQGDSCMAEQTSPLSPTVPLTSVFSPSACSAPYSVSGESSHPPWPVP
ncbi:immunoglobulin superfamily member 3-like [Talpa occidentalis]|uniref:immunoglobulin superfamily member 3-like n=1 Tax=Talpa occidentalis TaxID=50954 RepID=UPI0023F809E7|nr:immunoglobulin superfamily member 3-like [Talpa occidentalis]